MSCQVMYQSYYPYFPAYQPTGPVGSGRSDDNASRDPEKDVQRKKPKYSETQNQPSSHTRSSDHDSSHDRSFCNSSRTPIQIREEKCSYSSESEPPSNSSNKDDLTTTGGGAGAAHCDRVNKSAQYLNANCIIYTYFTGDISQVIDEHFSRALKTESSSRKSHKEDSIPLSQRNLPESFWNSEYRTSNHNPYYSSSYTQSPSDLYSVHDPYGNSALIAAGQAESWQNYMAAAGYNSAHRAAMHDVYSARLYPQYSSLLLQSGGRQGRSKQEAWPHHGPSSSHHGLENYNTHTYSSAAAAAAAATGLENPSQSSTSKDFYWF